MAKTLSNGITVYWSKHLDKWVTIPGPEEAS